MPRRLPLASGITALIVVLAGCGAASSAEPAAVTPTPVVTAAPTPVATAVATPSPAPTPDLGAIGRQYLAMATELNAALPTLTAALDGATTDEAFVAACTAFAAAMAKARDQLKEITFPIPIQFEVDRQLAGYEILRSEFEKLAADPSYDPGTALDDAAAQYNAAATSIRAFLGLPPPAAP